MLPTAARRLAGIRWPRRPDGGVLGGTSHLYNSDFSTGGDAWGSHGCSGCVSGHEELEAVRSAHPVAPRQSHGGYYHSWQQVGGGSSLVMPAPTDTVRRR